MTPTAFVVLGVALLAAAILVAATGRRSSSGGTFSERGGAPPVREPPLRARPGSHQVQMASSTTPTEDRPRTVSRPAMVVGILLLALSALFALQAIQESRGRGGMTVMSNGWVRQLDLSEEQASLRELESLGRLLGPEASSFTRGAHSSLRKRQERRAWYWLGAALTGMVGLMVLAMGVGVGKAQQVRTP